MITFSKQDIHDLRLTCSPRIEPFLQQELVALGLAESRVLRAAVETPGTLLDAMRLNLLLRTALRVLLPLKQFRCDSPDDLYDQAGELSWESLIPADGYLTITSTVRTPTIDHWSYANLKLKDAVVDRIAEKRGKRPDSGPERKGVVLHLEWLESECRIFLDTSGNKLSDRGYRKIPGMAPMQETLAAAVLIAAGYDGTMPLVNPMCGSGTLAIEAALIAAGRPPGLLRSDFVFMHCLGFDDAAYQRLRNELRKARREGPIPPIIATDRDERMVDAARKNAQTAGVEQLLQFHVCDFADTPLPDAPGLVLLNPEYGERMGQETELAATYKRIGDFLKQRCGGWTGYVFTGNLDLAKKIGLTASRRFEFYNAKIDCRLLKYEMYSGTRRKPKP